MTFEEKRKAIQDELDSINDLRQSGKPPYSLEPRVQKILDLLLELKSLTTDEDYKRRIDIARDDVFHTQHKEVVYVASSYEKTLKKKAARVRRTEFENDLSKAVSQLELDLFAVLSFRPTDHPEPSE